MTQRVALVTGGTRGIGAAISKAFQQEGYKIAANFAGNIQVAEKFHKETGIPTFQWDVGNFEACQENIKKIEADLGPIDILVNNAGITRDGMFHKMGMKDWLDVINTDLNSLFCVTRCVIEGMRSRQFGRIINIGSINGQKGQMGQVNYATAKAGLFGFTKALAMENANKNITVNAVAPGYVDTDMVRSVAPEVVDKIISQIPVGRLGKPEDVALCVLFLARDDATFITGATITSNGGQHLV